MKPRRFTLLIAKDGTIRHDGAVKSLSDVEAMLQEAAKTNPHAGISVVVRCHRNAPFKYATEILQACQQAGIKDVRVETDEGESQKAADPRSDRPSPREPM